MIFSDLSLLADSMSNRVLFNSLLKVYSFPLTKNEIKEKFVPKVRLSLVEKASPIEKISLPLVQSPEILIKRDDLLDSYGSGNKLRKLEFLFGALSSKAKCRHIMTAGSLHSNHCKAVAVLAARFGFQAHLLLRTERTFDDENILQGNPLLSYLLGAKIYLIPRKASIKTEIEPRIQQMRENFGGENFTFSIPVGGFFHSTKKSKTFVQVSFLFQFGQNRRFRLHRLFRQRNFTADRSTQHWTSSSAGQQWRYDGRLGHRQLFHRESTENSRIRCFR